MQTRRNQDLGSCLIAVLEMLWRQRKTWCEEGKDTGGTSLFLDRREFSIGHVCWRKKFFRLQRSPSDFIVFSLCLRIITV
jgi:hypothetical protein